MARSTRRVSLTPIGVNQHRAVLSCASMAASGIASWRAACWRAQAIARGKHHRAHHRRGANARRAYAHSICAASKASILRHGAHAHRCLLASYLACCRITASLSSRAPRTICPHLSILLARPHNIFARIAAHLCAACGISKKKLMKTVVKTKAAAWRAGVKNGQ